MQQMTATLEWQTDKQFLGTTGSSHSVLLDGDRANNAGASPMELIIWGQEEARYDVPVGPYAIGLGMCGPTMIAYASDEHKAERLPRMSSGEDIWCQLFSEPSAGSDVAGLRTRAEPDGDNINDGAGVFHVEDLADEVRAMARTAAAAAGSDHTERCAIGVAVDELHIVDRRAELVGGDLRIRRFVALTVRHLRGVDDDLRHGAYFLRVIGRFALSQASMPPLIR